MLEFAMFPPEINSGRMYAGPDAGPMTAASAAWDALADDLYLAAAAYASVVSDLTSSWLGPSSLSMATAAATYVSWISATAVQAEQTAAQAMADVAPHRPDVGDEPGFRRCSVGVGCYVRRLDARLGGLADEYVRPGNWHIC